MSCGVANAAVLTRTDDTGQETNGMTVLEQVPGKVGHYSGGERGLTLLVAASSRRFCEAVRGLQVVCYGCSLGNGDKAAKALQVHSLPGTGDTGSRARFSGTSGTDVLCHRLFCNDNSNIVWLWVIGLCPELFCGAGHG